MGLTLKGTKFIYTEADQGQVLLDCSDYLSNKSRIPLYSEGLNVLELLVELTEKERLFGTEFVLPSLLINILIASQLIRSAHPFRVLEYGCGDGRLSHYLAELLGVFNENSSLICAYDTLDVEWIGWKEKISQIKHTPKISYLVGDYSNLQLQKKYFDIVLFNGMANYNDPCQVFKNALQLLTDEGIIIYYADRILPLESTFKLFFSNSEEYRISPAWKIFLAKATDKCIKDFECDFELHTQSHIHEALELLKKEDAEKKEITDLIKALQQDIKTAISLENTVLKIRLLDIKSDLIENALTQHFHHSGISART